MQSMSILDFTSGISDVYLFIGASFKICLCFLLGSLNVVPPSRDNDISIYKVYDYLLQPILIINNRNVVLYVNRAALDFVRDFFSEDLANSSSVYLPSKFAAILPEAGGERSENYLISETDKKGALVGFHVVELPDQPYKRLIEVTKMDSDKDVDVSLIRRQQELQNSLDELSYIISHDLVEPVRTIKSFAQIVSRSYIQKLNNKDATEDFDFLIDAAERLYAMIKGMLEYSRLSATPSSNEEIDTIEVLVSVIKDLMTVTNDSNASIQCQEMPVIRFNKLLLAQVFSNIISNSLKYRSPDRSPKIEIHAEILEHEYLFVIKDNGMGFNNEQSERIFKIFQRLHPNDSKLRGTGIGLAICKKIIEKEKGRIWAEGEEGVGATFYFTIPR